MSVLSVNPHTGLGGVGMKIELPLEELKRMLALPAGMEITNISVRTREGKQVPVDALIIETKLTEVKLRQEKEEVGMGLA